MEVVHKLERAQKVVEPHTPQTLVAVVDMHPVQELKGVSEVLPTGWVGVQGNPTTGHLERVAVVTVGSEEEFLGRGQEAVDNTEVPEVAEAS